MKEDNCDLIKKFSQEFIKIIDDTKNDGNERSVNICPTNGDIELSKICIGDKCSIPTAEEIECKDNKIAIGNVHTHPGLGIRYGDMSENDILHSIAKGKKFACIGYRGIAKTITCYEYPYGVPKEDADKFKSLNYFTRELALTNNLKRYGINIAGGTYIPKSDTNKDFWKTFTKEANFLTESKEQFKKHLTPSTEKERNKNSCTRFLAPLNDIEI